MLRVKLDVLSQKKGALELSDCECIGLRISETVNGDTIATELGEIFSQAGRPLGIIKDCDATLNKGVRLWSHSDTPELKVIDDISHVMATALRKQYESSDAFKQFTTLVSGAAKKLRQTAQAFLVPPKLRSKGRFLSIARLGEWGKKILDVLGDKKIAQDDAILLELGAVLPEFEQARPFIEAFANTTHIIADTMKVLKNKGLEPATYTYCKALSAQLPDDTEVKRSLDKWLDKHIVIQRQLGVKTLPVSSDIIESLFGCFKHVIERSPQADMNRSALIIPALCGEINARKVSDALGTTRHVDLEAWDAENIP